MWRKLFWVAAGALPVICAAAAAVLYARSGRRLECGFAARPGGGLFSYTLDARDELELRVTRADWRLVLARLNDDDDSVAEFVAEERARLHVDRMGRLASDDGCVVPGISVPLNSSELSVNGGGRVSVAREAGSSRWEIGEVLIAPRETVEELADQEPSYERLNKLWDAQDWADDEPPFVSARPFRAYRLVLPWWSVAAASAAGLGMGAAATLIRPIRRVVRRRAGRCTACGYDLRGSPSPRCSECGTSIAAATHPASCEGAPPEP